MELLCGCPLHTKYRMAASMILHRDAPVSQSKFSDFPESSSAVIFPMPKKHTTVSKPDNA
jgi:hypothetical protein